MTDKRQSLQALRAIAFIGIFLTHCNIIPGLGSWGTSVFFVLSGFLMAYNYKERIDKKLVSVSYCIKFGIRRIRKIFPLHVLVTFASVPLEFILGNVNADNIGSFITNFFMHLFLLHSWIPSYDYYFSLNSLDWYLSVSLFLYIVFPFLILSIKKDTLSGRVTKAIIVFLLMLLCVVSANVLVPHDSSLLTYFSYIFPVLRLGDFYLGMILGLSVLDWGNRKPFINIHLLEVLISVLVVISVICSNRNYSNPIASAFSTTTILYLPTSLALVYVFYINQGILTKLLTNKLTVLIGNNSSYGYLIHQKVISYVLVYLFLLFNLTNVYVASLISICILILLIWGYRFLEEKILQKKYN